MSNSIYFSYPLVIIDIALILAFEKLGLFFQIVSDFGIRTSDFRPKAGILALFFQIASIRLVPRPTRGNRHPVNAPGFSDFGIRASDFRPKADILALFGFVFSPPRPIIISINHCHYLLNAILPIRKLALFFQISHEFTPGNSQ